MLPSLLLLLAACSQEPDFDERYKATETELRQRAAEMDAELQAGGASGEEETAGVQ